MDPEVVVAVLGVFVSGGALGIGGTLLVQWMGRQVRGAVHRPAPLADREIGMLREEVADLSRAVRNVGSRLDFQEQLVGGTLQPSRRPAPLLNPPAAPRAEENPPPAGTAGEGRRDLPGGGS